LVVLELFTSKNRGTAENENFFRHKSHKIGSQYKAERWQELTETETETETETDMLVLALVQ